MDYDLEKYLGSSLDVTIYDYGDLSAYEQWYRMAEDYISCSLFLINSMVEENFECNFFRAKACVFLFEHSVELFLKFSLSAANIEFETNHKLQEFYKEYCELYPEDEFRFNSDIENVVRKKPLFPHNTFPKYPGDKNGNLWSKDVYIDMISLLKNVKLTKEDFHRLKPMIIAKYKKLN